MNCPVCNTAMNEENFGGVSVDVCPKCSGIWFDWMELRKLDESDEGTGENLKKALDTQRADDSARDKIPCPKCSMKMHKHLYQFSKEVTIDECYQCGGIFLDAGELAAIRNTFLNEAERDKLAEKLLESIPGYKEGKLSHEQKAQRKENVGGLMRTMGKLFR